MRRYCFLGSLCLVGIALSSDDYGYGGKDERKTESDSDDPISVRNRSGPLASSSFYPRRMQSLSSSSSSSSSASSSASASSRLPHHLSQASFLSSEEDQEDADMQEAILQSISRRHEEVDEEDLHFWPYDEIRPLREDHSGLTDDRAVQKHGCGRIVENVEMAIRMWCHDTATSVIQSYGVLALVLCFWYIFLKQYETEY